MHSGKHLSGFLLRRFCLVPLCSVCIVSVQDSSVMSKIYDTLGRKYKAKGIDGVQDFGVCMHTFLLNVCVFNVFFLPNRVGGQGKQYGRMVSAPDLRSRVQVPLSWSCFSIDQPSSNPRSCLQIVNWFPPRPPVGIPKRTIYFEIFFFLSV